MSLDYINRRPYPGNANNISGIYDAAAPVGTPLGMHASDPTKFSLAGGKTFQGFLTRKVTTDGPVLADHVFPNTRAELAFKAGEEVSLEQADEADIGAGLCVTSGTGAIATNTAVGTGLSFVNGKIYQAQAGDFTFYRLSAQLPPQDGEAVRIRIEKL